MKKILYTILTAAAVLLGNYFFSNGTLEATVETPTPIVTFTLPAASATSPASNGTETSYMGTSFTIPFGLANGTQNEIVPQTSPNEPMLVWPTYTKIVLQGYPLQDTLYKPQILIFPADEYQKMSADPAASQGDATTTISTLQYILSTQKFIFQDPLPMLPDQHAYQLLYAQETILSFKNGSGIRYITSYSQAAYADIGANLIYTFQGITPDGKYYVSVMMPIELAGLDPAPTNAEQYPSYLSTTVDRLRQSGNPFNPSIESLDALVQSLLVGLPATSDMTPSPSTTEPTVSAQVDGLWITNVGKLNLKQNVYGSGEITGTMEGYGGMGRQDTLQGTLNGDTVILNSYMLGDLNLTFSTNTFKTADGSRNAFCGTRASESNELPSGCGFSGKWILTANSFFPESSFVVLKQTAGNVSGDFYDGKGNVFDKLTGQVTWSKGWWLGGKNEKGHTITLMMNSFETGFEYIYDDLFQLKLCAVRDGLNSADLGNFTCSL